MPTTCPVCELHAESVFKIEGMDCHEEVTILEHRLKRLTGLEALDADVLGQRLRVQHDAAKLSTAQIAEAVAETGMRAWLEHDEPRPASISALRDILVAVSGVALGVGLLLQFLGVAPLASRLFFATTILAAGIHTVTARVDLDPLARPRHQRADARGCRRRNRARPVVRGCLRRLPVRAGAAPRVARDGARPRRDSGADGSRRRSKRWSAGPTAATSASRSMTSASVMSWSCGPARRSRSTAGSSPATAT